MPNKTQRAKRAEVGLLLDLFIQHSEVPSSKFQAPNPKSQIPNKSQAPNPNSDKSRAGLQIPSSKRAPNSNSQNCVPPLTGTLDFGVRSGLRRIGIWSLGFGTFLELGAWGLELASSPSQLRSEQFMR